MEQVKSISLQQVVGVLLFGPYGDANRGVDESEPKDSQRLLRALSTGDRGASAGATSTAGRSGRSR